MLKFCSMRWLAGVLVTASACGLSSRQDAAHSNATGSDAAGSGVVGSVAAGPDTSSDDGAGDSGLAESEAAAASTGATGSSGPATDGNGTGGSNVRHNDSDHRDTLGNAAGGLTSITEASAGGRGGATPVVDRGGTTAAGGAAGGSGGATLVAGAGGCSGVVTSSSHALHCEGTVAWGEIYFGLFNADQNSGWSRGETFELWFRTTAVVAPLLSVWNQMAWDVLSINVVDGGLCAHFEAGRSPPYNDVCTPTRTLNDGAWHHAALTATASGLQFFEDGVLILEKPLGPPLALPDQPNAVYLCQGPDGPQGTSHFLAGDLDEVRIWSGVRTPDEIQSYRATELCSAANTESGDVYLAAYYRLDESGDDTSIDDDSAVPRAGSFYLNGAMGPAWIAPGAF